MAVLCAVVLALLLLVTAVNPGRTTLSKFELERRKAAGDGAAHEALERESLLSDVLSLQRVISALLLVTLVALLVATFGWLIGLIISVVIALQYGSLAKLSFVRNSARKLYEKYELPLLTFVRKYQNSIVRWVRNVLPSEPTDVHLNSREELEYVLKTSGALLSDNERKLITHGIAFGTREVSEIMTPRGVVDSISKNELLGPLVLDDLHKTGHSRFPVVDEDVDHIVGMLYIHELFTLDTTKSKTLTVEKAMEPRVFYIREDQTLEHALAAFLRTHHHLFVVINEFRETVGVVSLEDVLEALLGRKIIDEFDAHDDLRIVASRNPRENNRPKKREDV